MDEAARHLALLTRDDRGGQLVARPAGGAGGVAHEVAAALGTDACFVYLYDERADELVLRATHGTRVEDETTTPAHAAAARGSPGSRPPSARPVMIASKAHLDPRFKAFPNLPEDEYESILAVPILARDKLEGALNVRTREPRTFTEAEIELLIVDRVPGRRSRSSTRSSTRRRSGGWSSSRRWRASRRRSPSRSTSRSRSRRSSGRRSSHSARRAPRSCSRTAASPGRRDARARMPSACRFAGAGGRSASSSSIATRPSRTTTGSCSRRSPTRPPSRSSTGGWRCAACSPRRSTTASRTTSRPSPRCSGCRRGPTASIRAKALGDSVNRILAIAAVHEELTEHREDVVDLAELVDRLRAMLVQGLVAGKEVTAALEPVELAGQRATALALVFSELLRNALEHGGDHVSIELYARRGEVVLASRTTARASRGRVTAPACRSSARSSATSSAGARLSTTTACAPRSGSRRGAEG